MSRLCCTATFKHHHGWIHEAVGLSPHYTMLMLLMLKAFILQMMMCSAFCALTVGVPVPAHLLQQWRLQAGRLHTHQCIRAQRGSAALWSCWGTEW